MNWSHSNLRRRVTLLALGLLAVFALRVSAQIRSNAIPSIRIYSPVNGAVFKSPINIPIYAYTHRLTNILFYANGSNLLGRGQLINFYCLCDIVFPYQRPTNEYLFVWSNAPPGSYALTAVGTNPVQQVSVTSTPVNITILGPTPPPTNKPAIVSIIATDPVAIEGTNCWVWAGPTNSPPSWTNWPPTNGLGLFTNCGPNTATFTVYRSGDTNGNLTVTYKIGGTASNGVEYLTLPGSVTIPDGQSAALITIVPMDDGPPDINQTVVLTLTPPTNSPPNYVLGQPYRAAALIIDSGHPRPVTAMSPDRCFHLGATGPDAAWFRVEYTTDLLNWTALCTNQVVNGAIDFVDPDAGGDTGRFYRAVPDPGP